MPSPSNPSPRHNRSSSPGSGGGSSRSTPSGAPRSGGNKSRPPSQFDERTVDFTEPRRASSGGAKTSAGRSGGSKPASSKPAGSKSAKPATDAGVKRRALKKKRVRQGNFLAWTVAAAVTVMIGGAAAGVWSELQGAEGRVAQKRATLIDLRTQYEIGKKRLRALASASGKERVLVENGFIKPGERLLLFPKATPKKPGTPKE